MISGFSSHWYFIWLVVASLIAGVMNAMAGGGKYCLVSMVFAGAGGYVGAQYARQMKANVLRTIVVITGCMMAGYFFWRNG